MKNTDILVLNVAGRYAGITVPFDKMYFFKRTDQAHIPKLFRYALVMSVNLPLIKAIRDMSPHSLARANQLRKESTSQTIFPEISGKKIDKRKHSRKAVAAWWDEHIIKPYDLEARLVVIPILMKNKQEKILPKYLTAKRWFRQHRLDNRRDYSNVKHELKPIPEFAYVSTPAAAPNDKITPICMACPRSLQNLQGLCIPGQQICYKSIDLSTVLTKESNVSV